MKLRRFLNTALTFLAGNILSKLISFFLLPMYTSQIIPEQYGTYDLVMSFMNLVAPIAFFQIWDGMFRFAFDYQKIQDKQKVISNTMVAFAMGIALYFLMFFGIQAYFQFDYFGYILLHGFVYALHYVYTYAARLFLKNKLFVFSGLANTLVTALLNILWIVVFDWDIKAIYLASTLGSLLQMLIIELRVGVLRHIRLRNTDKTMIRNMLKFSIPLCVATVSYWLLSGFTKVIINRMLGAGANGLYAVANRFAAMITLAVSVVQFAWNEAAYLMADDQNRNDSYRVCIDLMTKAVGFGTAILCPAIKLVFPLLVDAQYADAIWLIPATVIGVGANSLAGFLGTLFLTEKKTGFILVSTLIAAVTNVLLGGVSAWLFGLQGAIVVLAVSFVLLMVLRLAKLCRQYCMKLSWQQILMLLLVLVASVVGFFLVESVVLLILMCLVFAGGFIFSVRRYIRPVIQQIRSKNTEQK